MRNKFYSSVTTFLVTTLMLLGCSTQHLIPTQTTTNVQTVLRDSVVIHRDTITYQIPIESSEAFNVQHSHLETTVAISEASVDSLGMLKHNLVNKPFKIEKEIVYQDRKVVEYRDSLVTKEIPVEVQVPVRYVPKFYKLLLVFNIILVLLLALWVYFKFKK